MSCLVSSTQNDEYVKVKDIRWLAVVAAFAFAATPGCTPQQDGGETKAQADSASKLLLTSKLSKSVTAVAMSDDGKYVLAVTRNCFAICWDASTGAEVQRYNQHRHWVTDVAFSGDGSRVLTGSEDNTAIIQDLKTGEVLRTFVSPDKKAEGERDQLRSGCHFESKFLAQDRWVLTNGDPFGAIIWDAATGERLSEFHDLVRFCTAVHPNSSKVATGTERWPRLETAKKTQGGFLIWDPFDPAQKNVSSRAPRQRRDETGPITALSFNPEKMWLLSNSSFNTAFLFDTNSGETIMEFENVSRDGTTSGVFVRCVALSHDATQLVAGLNDGTAHVWAVDSPNKLLLLDGHTDDVESVVFSRDGSRILTGSSDGSVILWDAQDGAELRRFEVPDL